jgi:hypothetical protein
VKTRTLSIRLAVVGALVVLLLVLAGVTSAMQPVGCAGTAPEWAWSPTGCARVPAAWEYWLPWHWNAPELCLGMCAEDL